jgi:RES domain-containing protein
VYLAEHPALAALELRVHLDLPFELLPADFVLMRVTVPDGPLADADADADAAAATVATGDSWLTEARSAALQVPSVLVPHSWNLLLNPRHPEAARAEVHEIEPFGFDPRLWRPLAGEN